MNIESDEVDRLARELVAESGETLTEAVETALRERLQRERARKAASMRMRLVRLTADVAAMQIPDGRTPEEIIVYDNAGLPC
jgi:antitoxin VapB